MYSEERWAARYRCRVVRAESFREGLEDLKRIRAMFSGGNDHLIDRDGIDWWKLLVPLLISDALDVLIGERAASLISGSDQICATRRGRSVRILESVAGRTIQSFSDPWLVRSKAKTVHYSGLLRRFSIAQLTQIALDKYDSDYRWRSRFSSRQRVSSNAVVLIPSGYSNVSRMATAYAQLLPEQEFLLVATRASAKQFSPGANVRIADLAVYASKASQASDDKRLMDAWTKLRRDFCHFPGLSVLADTGVMDSFPDHIRNGVSAREAWRGVLDREPVFGVLCGDDSNFYTRIPVHLAANRGIPTVDFHHGAFDGYYSVKELPSDLYLAKNEMELDYLTQVCDLPAERIVVASPPDHSAENTGSVVRNSILFFSEPYEVAGMRAIEVYRETLPHLCRLARGENRKVLVKLHPFESKRQRSRFLEQVLSPEDREFVSVVDGPLTPELLARAYFGVTVESTTVVDCLRNRVPCFLCGWLSLSPFQYARQYARFGIGDVLQNPQQIASIPERLEQIANRPANPLNLLPTPAPGQFRSWLTVPSELIPLRTVS